MPYLQAIFYPEVLRISILRQHLSNELCFTPLNCLKLKSLKSVDMNMPFKCILTISIAWQFQIGYAQTPQEICFKILNSSDYLSDEIDQMYSYRFKKQISDRDIKNFAELSSDYKVVANRQSYSNASASVNLTFTPIKDSVAEAHLYFLFVKEDNKWKFDNYMFDGSVNYTSHIGVLKEAVKLYKNKDFDIGQKSKEEIEWGLDHMGPRSLFSKEVLSKQHGIAIARTLNNYFLTRATHVRDIAYAIHYLSPTKTQLNQLDDYLNFASQDLEQNVAMVKGKLNTLENELKKNKLPEGNIRKWLDQKSMDWASFGVEYADTIGFSGYCEGCFDLALVNLGDYRKGLLYINDKSKLLPIKYGSYLTLIPIKDSWYFYTTY